MRKCCYFAMNLQRLRLERGMNQATLAEITGVSIASIAAYENGRRLPSFEVCLRLADCFDVAMDCFFEP